MQQKISNNGDKDLEEHGERTTVTQQVIDQQVSKLDDQLKTVTEKSRQPKAASLKKKLEDAARRINKYDQQIRTAGKPSRYNTTDKDASPMRMKNKVEILPAYNVLAGCENQFITGVSVHQNPNDRTCFQEHLEQTTSQQPIGPQNVIADSIFGTYPDGETHLE